MCSQPRTLCTAHSRGASDVLSRACAALKWTDVQVKKTSVDVFWVSSQTDFDSLVGFVGDIQIQSKQRINRIPGMSGICTKVPHRLIVVTFTGPVLQADWQSSARRPGEIWIL